MCNWLKLGSISLRHRLPWVILAVLCRPFVLLAPNNYLALQSFDLEHTWWRLLQKNVFCTQNERFTFCNPKNDSDTKNNLFSLNYLKNVFRVINMPFSAIWWWMISLKRWQIHADFKQFIIFSYSVMHRKYIHLLRVCFPFNWEIPHQSQKYMYYLYSFVFMACSTSMISMSSFDLTL